MRPVVVALLFVSAACAQIAASANSGYKTAEGRARVAATLTRSERDQSQKPQELVDHMGIKPGMVVADVGTGPGYMLPYLSKAVGPKGKVIAEDIHDDFLGKARTKASTEGLSNVEFVKGSERTPNLPEGKVDVALALDSYHHYDFPREMLAGIAKGLKPGGTLVIVEYYKRPGAMPNGNAMEHIRIDQPEVIREVESAGFKLLSSREHIQDSQYMLVFGAK
jgi:predicted methyltransferase